MAAFVVHDGLIYGASWDSTVRSISVATGELDQIYRGHEHIIHDIQLHANPEGPTFYTGAGDHLVSSTAAFLAAAFASFGILSPCVLIRSMHSCTLLTLHSSIACRRSHCTHLLRAGTWLERRSSGDTERCDW